MARLKEFNSDLALNAAMAMFSEHGFEGTSAAMLVQAMGIGRQSMYDTFGDKWQLYQAALRRYLDEETDQHIRMLRSQPRAVDGVRAMIDRVIMRAPQSCLGVSSICEFGRTRSELVAINDAADRTINSEIVDKIRDAQAAGDIAGDVDPESVADFFFSTIAGLRIAARNGASVAQLSALGDIALRVLR